MEAQLYHDFINIVAKLPEARTLELKATTILYRAEERPSSRLFLLNGGLVRLNRTTGKASGNTATTELLTDQGVIGTEALILPPHTPPRYDTAQALTTITTLGMTQRTIESIRQIPDLHSLLSQLLTEGDIRHRQSIADSTISLDYRAVKFILDANFFPEKYQIAITSPLLSELFNISEEYSRRIIRVLRERGALITERVTRRIIILDGGIEIIEGYLRELQDKA